MTLSELILATIHPYEMILVFDEEEHTLYDLPDYILTKFKSGISYVDILSSKVFNICVNGDAIQCEVLYE